MKIHRFTLFFLTILFSISTVFAQSLDYENGIRKGYVKVKFKTSMSAQLASMPQQFNAESVGSTALTKVSVKYSASPLRRLFPKTENVTLEAKHQKHGLHLWYIIEVDQNANIQQVVNDYKGITDFAVVEGEHAKTMAPYTKTEVKEATINSALPFNDPHLDKQWHYNNAGQIEGTTTQYDINLFEAWGVNASASNVIVAIHDQGVDTNHPDLIDNLWVNELELNGEEGVDDDGNGYIDDIHGWNFRDNTGAISPEEHGTHVAGTVSAVNNNGIGVAGVAGGTGYNDGAKIMSMQFLGGGSVEPSFVYAADNGAVISQNSWGYTTEDVYDQSVLDAIDYFIAEAGNYQGSPMKGGIVIFASGNSDYEGNMYPGYYEKCVAVSALGPEGLKANYSNYGTWMDIAAPGGNSELYGPNAGVLSTLPGGTYGYFNGTSMACPHVSGIAALVLGNAKKQLSAEELRRILETSVQNVDALNNEYVGKLGVGQIDAALAMEIDEEIAPLPINDLAIADIAQEFAIIKWTIPTDEDDTKPASFNIYTSTEELNAENLVEASTTLFTTRNTLNAGDEMTFEINDLYGLTDYYFVVESIDRWGNTSAISNVLKATTNAGPKINVDENSQTITLSIGNADSFTKSHPLQILNEGEGLLRWKFNTRHINTSLSWNSLTTSLFYNSKDVLSADIGIAPVSSLAEKTRAANEVAPLTFTQIEKYYGARFGTAEIGETDTTFSNSAATVYHVTEENGFNLTDLIFWLKHDHERNDVIFEIYKGDEITSKNLLLTQPYRNSDSKEHYADVQLNEQLYFEKGSKFTVVCHVPAGPLYPLGASQNVVPEDAYNCLISIDWGKSWVSLPNALRGNTFYVWNMLAISKQEHLGEYITLNSAEGEVSGNDVLATELNVDATQLINGTYAAVGIFNSNDGTNPELRVPINITVAEQMPEIASIQTLNFGSVFLGTSHELVLSIVNNGYGNFNNIQFTSSTDDFVLVGYPNNKIKALSSNDYTLSFTPSAAGNINGTLLLQGDNGIHEIRLFGVGTMPAEITVSPLAQTINDVTIGDEVNTSVTVQNTGEYPLTYFVPGFEDVSLIEDWEGFYHQYGYKPKVSHRGETTYEWIEIKETGIDATDFFKRFDRTDVNTHYFAIDLPFYFPFYDEQYSTLYFTTYGVMTVANDIGIFNTPKLDYLSGGPEGMVSALGASHVFTNRGEVFYQVESDRLIVQYEGISYRNEGYGQVTLQFVIYDNGNIKLNYKDINERPVDDLRNWNVFIENPEKNDGFRLAGPGELKYDNQNLNMHWESEMSIAFDYPGPNIITNISNASGILKPGEEAVMDITLNTDNLWEGVVTRAINIIHNDPINISQIPQVHLDIVGGGVSEMVITADTISFGDIYKGKVFAENFFVRNVGTADLNITNVAVDNPDFQLVGVVNPTIKANHSELYEVTPLSGSVQNLVGKIMITLEDGSTEEIVLEANIVDAPQIAVDTTALSFDLDYGTSTSFPLSISNTGEAPLDVVISGTDWLYEDQMQVSALDTLPDFTYTFRKSNDEENAPEYSWIEIRNKESVQHINAKEQNINEPEGCWYPVDLPYAFNYYGSDYLQMHIGFNGAITFAGMLEVEHISKKLPSEKVPNSILPFWAPGGYDVGSYGENEIGVFYHINEERIVVTFQSMSNVFAMGDPISSQAILYRDGTMKFQYKIEGEHDEMTHLVVIGLQNEDLSDVVSISHKEAIDISQGFAIAVLPAIKKTIAVGETFNTTMKVDANKIYGGTHSSSVKIRSNSPNEELLEKNITVNVTGTKNISVTDSVNYGDVLVQNLGSKYKDYIQELVIRNDGTETTTINTISLDNVESFKVEYPMDNGFGGVFWRSIRYWRTPVALVPGGEMTLRLTYTPTTTSSLLNGITINTDAGDHTVVITGNGVEPPIMVIDNTMQSFALNTSEDVENFAFTIENIDGGSNLDYELSIDYQRTGVAVSQSSSKEVSLQNTAIERISIFSIQAAVSNVNEEFNRVFYSGNSDLPDTYVGFNGVYSFIGATRFNGGETGFNLSHVLTFMNMEALESGELEVDIYAGGPTIYDAAIVNSTSYQFTSDMPGADNGQWVEIPLSEEVTIYPNEYFFVVIKYPFDLNFPQGLTKGEHGVNDYLYQLKGEWHSLQSGGFANDAYMVKAAEMQYKSNAWVTLDAVNGTIEKGASHTITGSVFGTNVMSGEYQAELVVRSNDIENPTEFMPLQLNMNEGPLFGEIMPFYEMDENSILEIPLTAFDQEGDALQFTLVEEYENATITDHLDGTATVVISHDYDAAPSYSYEVKVSDSYGRSTQATLNVNVFDINRGPTAHLVEDISINFGEITEQTLDLSTLFTDADDDILTFTISSDNAEVTDVFMNNTTGLLRINGIGEAVITVVANDAHNGSTNLTFKVIVQEVEDPTAVDDFMDNVEVSIKPNPASDNVTVTWSENWKGKKSIYLYDLQGKLIQTFIVEGRQKSHSFEINDLQSSIYLIHIQSGETYKVLKLMKQ